MPIVLNIDLRMDDKGKLQSVVNKVSNDLFQISGARAFNYRNFN